MSPDEIIAALVAVGWREFPCHFESKGARAFAKSFEGHAECKCNQGKRKQIEVYFWPLQLFHGHTFQPRFRVDCVGELPSNQWLRMNIEALTTLEEINLAVASLLAAWDASVDASPNLEEEE